MQRLHILSYASPFVTLTAILAGIAGFISPSLPGILFVGQILFVGIYSRKTMQVQHEITGMVDVLHKYAGFLRLVEKTTFDAALLNEMKQQLYGTVNQSPGMVIRRLAKLLNWLDSNLNILVSIMLNGLLMFNLHVLIGIENWKRRYAKQVPEWFRVMAGFDAFSSLGNFAFSNPGYVFPDLSQDGNIVNAKDLGHPLIGANTCVTNDIEVNGLKNFSIITGANMSGKSTLLRTLGVNMVLAMVGAPVFARHFSFSPVQIRSSIRTSDSLARKESYFFAELRRLKQIMDELRAGEALFILMDEVLKGTNSKDKQTGSFALIRQLIRFKAAGLFATHDLALGSLKDEFPEHIQNLCFEIAIEGESLHIDYKLRPGICQNLNASWLMKHMGILE